MQLSSLRSWLIPAVAGLRLSPATLAGYLQELPLTQATIVPTGTPSALRARAGHRLRAVGPVEILFRRSVPAVFFVPGDGPYEGLSATTSARLRSVLRGRCHTPDDNWDERFPFEGLGRPTSPSR